LRESRGYKEENSERNRQWTCWILVFEFRSTCNTPHTCNTLSTRNTAHTCSTPNTPGAGNLDTRCRLILSYRRPLSNECYRRRRWIQWLLCSLTESGLEIPIKARKSLRTSDSVSYGFAPIRMLRTQIPTTVLILQRITTNSSHAIRHQETAILPRGYLFIHGIGDYDYSQYRPIHSLSSWLVGLISLAVLTRLHYEPPKANSIRSTENHLKSISWLKLANLRIWSWSDVSVGSICYIVRFLVNSKPPVTLSTGGKPLGERWRTVGTGQGERI